MERTTIPVAVAPGDAPWAEDAIRRGGGEPAGLDENPAGLVWTEPGATDELRGVLRAHPGISWVQLPMAGIERVARSEERRVGKEWRRRWRGSQYVRGRCDRPGARARVARSRAARTAEH